MGMGIVDTIFVGRLGAEAIGAVSIGSSVFLTVAVFGMGLLLGLDTLISRAFGAGEHDDCRRTVAQGVYIGLAVTLPLTGLVFMAGPWLDASWQLTGSLALWVAVGYFLDRWLGTRPWLLVAGSVLGMIVGFYLFFRAVAAIGKHE